MGIRQVDYQSIVKKYDWGELIGKYDKNFDSVID
tara:strand:- start:24705 stop:24806 length:102 start_codon:yes stop_codon:yes gene_type:complete